METKKKPSKQPVVSLKTRVPVNAVIFDGSSIGAEEVYIPVGELADPGKQAFTTKYGSKTVEVKQYQTDLLSLLFQIRGISSRNPKS